MSQKRMYVQRKFCHFQKLTTQPGDRGGERSVYLVICHMGWPLASVLDAGADAIIWLR